MPTVRRIVDVGVAGAPTTILATVPCRRYRIRESLLTHAAGANVPQGIHVQDFTAPSGAIQVPVGMSAITLPAQPIVELDPPVVASSPGDFPTFSMPDEQDASFHECHGMVIANGPGVNIGTGETAALPLAAVASKTATGTSVEVIEDY